MAGVTSYSHFVGAGRTWGKGYLYEADGRKTWKDYKHSHKWVACKEMTAHPQRAVRREAKMKQLDFFLENKYC